MTSSHLGWAASVLTVFLALDGRAPVLAADGPENAVLKKNGLKVVGSLAVLETETEVKNKLSDLRRISRQLNYSLMQQQGTMSPEDFQKAIKGLGAEINQMKAQINALTQQMNRMPRGRRGFLNNFVADQYAELNLARIELQDQVNQEVAWLNQLKSQHADPKSKDKIDGEVRDRRDAYHQALLEYRKLADDATEKYAALAKDNDVKKAMEAVRKAMGTRIKLGPSRDFTSNLKLLEKYEKAEASGEPDETTTKPGRRSRIGPKSKRTSKSHSGSGPPSSEDPGSSF
jgi:hypothetical protein